MPASTRSQIERTYPQTPLRKCRHTHAAFTLQRVEKSAQEFWNSKKHDLRTVCLGLVHTYGELQLDIVKGKYDRDGHVLKENRRTLLCSQKDKPSADDKDAMKAYREECKLYREIRFTQVADRLAESCKYFKFTETAISSLVDDVVELHRAIRNYDRHLVQDDEGAYTCNCLSNGALCPPLPTWCNVANLSTYRLKSANNARRDLAKHSNKRQKLNQLVVVKNMR